MYMYLNTVMMVKVVYMYTSLYTIIVCRIFLYHALVHVCISCTCISCSCTCMYIMFPPSPDTVKVSDFGLSTVFRHMGKERKLSRRCGTPPYIAPEVHTLYSVTVNTQCTCTCSIHSLLLYVYMYMYIYMQLYRWHETYMYNTPHFPFS